jgi:signal transduction histidine kinase/CheY-like chemotaxis protein/HPt (histidine-containing phosphotransfer) domain-containing protein
MWTDTQSNPLTTESTLGELPSFDASVSVLVRTEQVAKVFESTPDLPGVIVREEQRILGVLSRENYQAQLCRPFRLELFLNRPVGLLLDKIEHPPLMLPASTSIHAAAHAALSRRKDQVFAPIVMLAPSGPRLLDAHSVLLGQSSILELANETIQRQKEAAEAASVAKSRFLANMSHEIRTPLTAVLGFAEDLLDDPAPDERDAAVGTILRNGRHLLEVLNGILDLSKIEAGKIEIELAECDPLQIIVDACDALQVKAAEKKLTLVHVCDGPLPRTIMTDPTRLRQILFNLIGNAVKFTEAGKVAVIAGPANETSAAPRLEITVADTGIGLSSDEAARLFQPFTQADSSTTRRFGGTGLGLSISRQFARLLGGDITLASQPGVGSRFTMTLPISIPEEQPSAKRPPLSAAASGRRLQPLPPCRVLLVEDSPDNRLLIRRFLEKAGATATVAQNGQEALQAVRAAIEAGEPPNVILMDMQMPILDGYAATRALRSSGCRIPIIALTANAMRSDIQKCLDAGCDDHASKPIVRAVLLEQIRGFIETPRFAINPVAAIKPSTKGADPAPLDWEVALARCGGDPELLADVAGAFLEMTPELLRQWTQAWEDGDRQTAQRVSHTLKSAAANLGAGASERLAADLERALQRAPEISPALNSGSVVLVDQFEMLMQAVQERFPAAAAVSEVNAGE